MKRKFIYLIIALCLLSIGVAAKIIEIYPADARMTTIIVGGGVADTPGCTTPTTGDELNEGWLGAGAENTWATQGTITVDEDEVLNGTPPSGSCTEGLNIVNSASNGTRYWNKGSAIDTSAGPIRFYFSFYINSITLDSYAYGSLYVWDTNTDPSGGQLFDLRFRNNAGTYQIQFTDVTSTRVNLATSTWYEVVVYINTGGTSYFQVTGGGSTTCDLTTDCTVTVSDIDGQYLHFGSNGLLGAGEAYDIDIGYAYISTP